MHSVWTDENSRHEGCAWGWCCRGAGPRRALDGHLPAVLQLLSLEPLLTSEDTRVRRCVASLEASAADVPPACPRRFGCTQLCCSGPTHVLRWQAVGCWRCIPVL